MENEKSGQNGFHGRASGPPFTSATQAKTPLISSRPLAGAEASRFGAVQQPRFSGPTILPPQASYPPAVVGFDTRFQTPQFPSPDRPRPTMTRLPFQLSTGQQPMSQSVPNSPQPYIPSVPMRPPQRNMNPTLSRGNTHPSASPPLQSTTQGYSYKQPDPVQVLPPQNHPFLAHQGGPAPLHPPPQNPHFSAQQGGYAPGPPLPQNPPFIGQGGYTPHYPPPGTNLGVQMQPPSGGAPVGAIQGLVENFSSLSVGSSPGSIGPGIDIKALPRPLDGDTVPKILTEMFPSNCDSRFFRLTTSAIPNSKSLLSRWHLPLGAVVQPLAEAPDGEEIPTVNFGSAGIVRCRRCRIYVNPYVTFTDGGRKWRCNLCALFNDVPGDYFAPLDASGRRSDLDQRPELTKGSVEFVAPTEYMMRPPMPPLYFFLIDVSVTAARNGMLEIVAKTIKSCLDELPGSSRTQIGFLTFDSTLHFYNMRSSMSQPQMMVMSDLEDIFVPLPDDLLVNLSESRNVVDSFLDSLPSMFQDNVNVESAFGPALKAASMVMGLLGGKLLIFQTTLPSLGVGRLRLRGNDPHLYGTDKEHASRVPEEPFYKQMAADLTKYQIGANVYAFSEKYTDLASLGTLAKYTGGQVYYYPGFQVDTHGEKLRYELARDLTRETAWESVLCIRCGKGVRFTTFHGHFMLRSTDLLALPAVDCDKAFGAQLSLDDQLLINQTVYFQVALLYSSSAGERRIRVHTAAVPVVTDLSEMYRQADIGAIVTLLGRLAIEKTLSDRLEVARQFVQLKIVNALKEYRNLYAMQHRLGGKIIYPESLKYLVLYGLALCKSLPLRGGYADVHLDERCASGFTMMIMSVKRLLKLLYPNLARIDDYLLKAPAEADDFGKFLQKLPLSSQNLDSRGLYIYDDGLRFIIWFGGNLSDDVAKSILGEDLSGIPDFSRVYLSEQGNQISRKIIYLVKKLRESDPSNYQICHLVRQGDQPSEISFLLGNLTEDQIGGTSSYVDWMLQIHRQVQNS